eukprot:3838312-Rhodomonas_salina.3
MPRWSSSDATADGEVELLCCDLNLMPRAAAGTCRRRMDGRESESAEASFKPLSAAAEGLRRSPRLRTE